VVGSARRNAVPELVEGTTVEQLDREVASIGSATVCRSVATDFGIAYSQIAAYSAAYPHSSFLLLLRALCAAV
jgi:hypothetical protein